MTISSKINLNAVHPFKPKTAPVIDRFLRPTVEEKAAFNGVQDFAKKVLPLRDLQQKFNEGQIDLGSRDRAIAIAACIGASLLVTASVAVFFASIAATGALLAGALLVANPVLLVIVPCSIGMTFGPLLIGGSGVLLGEAWNHTFEIFQRPSPDQLQTQVDALADCKPTQENLDQLGGIVEKLQERKGDLMKTWDEEIRSGDTQHTRLLREQSREIDAAMKDLETVISDFGTL